MSFDWYQYWQFAEECQLQAATMVSEEAALRAAISRAYYSVFCRARNIAVARGVAIPKTGAAHIVVRDYFKNSSNLDEQKIGAELDRLRKKRTSADYEDNFPGDLLKATQFAISDSKFAHAIIATLP